MMKNAAIRSLIKKDKVERRPRMHRLIYVAEELLTVLQACYRRFARLEGWET